ncbi:MAG: glycogen/starch/alpha-glucan phosphorylase, partial [Escherichia coli]|nr:glycogen/starch/alpha-glucan phosphorylase [Escherichia coli]
IFEINDYFLKTLQEQYPNDTDLLGRASIIDESNGRRVRMAWLAVVVSHKVNGVSELHSNLMVQSLFADFAKIFPGRFTNVTNGVTPRRWLAVANPSLSAVLDEHLGRNWRTDLSLLNELQQHCDFPMVNHAVHQAKLENKKRLAEYIAQQLNVVVNPKALFDVQIKRIHEYKRQLMNVLHVITRYNRIKADPDAKWVPRVNIFGGKAASAYYMAKKVVFIPNYSVSLAQLIIPAADLSEQISLAGTEASGTSNMKFALNGALTIGTLDGANVEMLDHVGADNIFIFGNTAEEVEELRRQGYKPREYYEKDEELHQVLTQIGSGVFSPEDPGRYRDLVKEYADHIWHIDPVRL